MLTSDLAQYLETQGIGTRAKDIFIEKLPDNTDNCVRITESPDEVGKYIPINRVRIQIFVRNKTYAAGKAKAMAIFNLIDKKDDRLVLVTGGTDVLAVQAMQTPTGIGQDEKERYIFTCNYLFTIRGNSL
jgi:hypothetical protein